MKSCASSSWLLVAVLVAGGTLSATPPSWDSLLGNSPFGSTPVGTTPAVSGALEFRGYFAEGREQYFSLYDPAHRRAFWLREGQADAGLQVRSFDAARQVLAVEINGQTQSLPLKVALLQAGTTPAPASSQAAPKVSANGTGTTATGSNVLESEEVRRAEQNLARARQRQVYDARQKMAQQKQRATRAAGKP